MKSNIINNNNKKFVSFNKKLKNYKNNLRNNKFKLIKKYKIKIFYIKII